MEKIFESFSEFMQTQSINEAFNIKDKDKVADEFKKSLDAKYTKDLKSAYVTSGLYGRGEFGFSISYYPKTMDVTWGECKNDFIESVESAFESNGMPKATVIRTIDNGSNDLKDSEKYSELILICKSK